ncbi:MAG: serine--tRNA ligase [Prevotellaceae bacterium]|jgi:seryl-tRNA synthetase|nr:serine--tRNA ligase [Prevotellaceae bacterium]
MLTVKVIENNPEYVVARLAIKGKDVKELVNEILAVENDRKKKQVELENLLAEQNRVAKEAGIRIGILKKEGKHEEAETEKQNAANETVSFKAQSASVEKEVSELEKILHSKLIQLPNLPHESVPEGKSPEHNITVREGGKIPELKNKVPHWELCSKYGLVDFEAGNKLTGAGFPVYRGKGAKLQRALISMFLDYNIENGYNEVQPPLLVNEDSGFGTGQLPDKEGQMYHVAVDGFYLIPTSEVPVTNLYRNVIVPENELPIKMTAYTPCFRREAGSYGKDVRGLNRLHQFDKVEIVQITTPDSSYKALDEMVAHVECLINKLELPYRIMRLCGGDMSFHSALTYDFEVYSAAQERWLEVSSVSNFETFQANRLKLRYKSQQHKKTELAHTLNGSSLALPRIVAALLENNFNGDEITLPQAVAAYTGFKTVKN